MISRQRYKLICNNLLQAVKDLAHDENDYQDFIREQGITKEEVEEIEKLETPIIFLITQMSDNDQFNEADPFENKMNRPICEK